MVRRTNVIMALDGILFDTAVRREQGYSAVQNEVFLRERIARLRKWLDQEERYAVSQRVKA